VLKTLPRTLFISDLHLCPSRPQTTRQLSDFLCKTARGAQALYVLGDLFEYWAGDDDLDSPYHQEICVAFKQLSESGTRLAFMHGNRDFLFGEKFIHAAGGSLLTDPFLTEIHGRKALLMHGDTLCTDDVEYQSFRQQVRDPSRQQAFLAQPLAARKAQIEAMRMRSEQEKSYKQEAIMDVNQQAIADVLRQYDYPELLVHGHTHRPGEHSINLDGHTTTRWVLGDWYESGNYLTCSGDGCKAIWFDASAS
jgi:UDP-2,3-diacylglucosamine hydrolase